jgi:iron complex outermembrane receptor protein
LRASWAVDSRQEVRFGVHNLFDKTYAEHLNRANQDPFNPQAVQVNEPGRSVWVKYKYSF